MKKLTKALLRSLADRVYNEQTGEYLRLCQYTTLDGPDPSNPSRHMHCAVGELAFELTGNEIADTDEAFVAIAKAAGYERGTDCPALDNALRKMYHDNDRGPQANTETAFKARAVAARNSFLKLVDLVSE